MSTSTEPIGYANGTLVPFSQLSLPILDQGFIHGVTVAEQVRTFRGQPFLLDDHYQRWTRGLEVLGIELPCTLDELRIFIAKLIDHNARLLPDGSEQGICFFATPGCSRNPWSEFLDRDSDISNEKKSQFSIYTYPIQMAENQRKYRQGIELITARNVDVPNQCWPKGIKVRSRLHYYLAQRQAAASARSGGFAYPILLDLEGHVSDSSIGSIVGWSNQEGLIVRPAVDRYDSITLRFVIRLANSLGLKVTERYMKASELTNFDELYLVSTPWCIYPVTQVDNVELDDVKLPAATSSDTTFRRLMQAWETFVGCSILN
ncbi:MAG: aminotransferase class IV [Pirellulales bacterium]